MEKITKPKQCNICGKEFDEWDEQQDFQIDCQVYYGSKHDGEKVKCNFCCDCFDELLDTYILPKCSINPIEDTGDF